MNRRGFLSVVAAGTAISGCLSADDAQDRKAVGVRLKNDYHEEREVRINATDHGDVVLNETFAVEGESTLTKDGLLEAGSYEVTASIEGVGSESTDWHMSGCSENAIYVTFDDTGLWVSEACHND
ncbi:hypothetical protein BRD15_00440 [Halobacteriales archaeon SW_6_65_15]|nr:MAG: hypothetical protein BRD15_00440 [Halobacteriales archaeon SW_6_65_15]